MKIEIRSRDKRALLGMAAAIGIYFAVSMLLMPAYDRLKTGADMVQGKEEELQKYRRALLNRDHYTQLLEQARKSYAESEARLIHGENGALAQVELQNIVEDAEKKVSIPPAPYTVSPPKKKDPYFNEITLSLSFESTPNQLVSFLAALRDSPKVVTVRNLQVVPVQVVFEPPVKEDLKKMVHANVVVSALVPSEPAKKG